MIDVVDRWLLFRGHLCSKNPKIVVIIDKWSLFRGCRCLGLTVLIKGFTVNDNETLRPLAHNDQHFEYTDLDCWLGSYHLRSRQLLIFKKNFEPINKYQWKTNLNK